MEIVQALLFEHVAKALGHGAIGRPVKTQAAFYRNFSAKVDKQRAAGEQDGQHGKTQLAECLSANSGAALIHDAKLRQGAAG